MSVKALAVLGAVVMAGALAVLTIWRERPRPATMAAGGWLAVGFALQWMALVEGAEEQSSGD